jgi:hypothetical protein
VRGIVAPDQNASLAGNTGRSRVRFCNLLLSPASALRLVVSGYSENSRRIDFDSAELVRVWVAIKSLKGRFPVMNPAASIDDIELFVRREEQMFACVGGYKLLLSGLELEYLVFVDDFAGSKGA